MEALGESNEGLRNEVHELKGKMDKILKTLLSLKRKASEETLLVAHTRPSVIPTYPSGFVPVHAQP